jgi:hypothetical protein
VYGPIPQIRCAADSAPDVAAPVAQVAARSSKGGVEGSIAAVVVYREGVASGIEASALGTAAAAAATTFAVAAFAAGCGCMPGRCVEQ